MTPINWFFRWSRDGYNSVQASSKEEALAKAIKLGGGKLVPRPDTLVPDAEYKLTLAEDHRYAGCFD